MGAPDVAPVTAALVALVASVGSVGQGALPTAADPPFAIVYPITGGGDLWGPAFTDPQSGAALMYQITIVDVSLAGAETFADTVRRTLLDRDADGAFVNPLPVAGLAVLDRELVAYGGVDRDRGVFNVRDTYQIHVTRTT